jgi:hypothetical protein
MLWMWPLSLYLYTNPTYQAKAFYGGYCLMFIALILILQAFSFNCDEVIYLTMISTGLFVAGALIKASSDQAKSDDFHTQLLQFQPASQ